MLRLQIYLACMLLDISLCLAYFYMWVSWIWWCWTCCVSFCLYLLLPATEQQGSDSPYRFLHVVPYWKMICILSQLLPFHEHNILALQSFWHRHKNQNVELSLNFKRNHCNGCLNEIFLVWMRNWFHSVKAT